MLRAVLDTNIVISGTIRKSGDPFRILEAWRQGAFLLITSHALMEEVGRVFNYPRMQKYGLTPDEIRRVILAIRRYSVITAGKLRVSAVHEDPADNEVLAAAIEGEADYIVSGDAHLQDLGRYQGILIVTPKAFLEIVKRSGCRRC